MIFCFSYIFVYSLGRPSKILTSTNIDSSNVIDIPKSDEVITAVKQSESIKVTKQNSVLKKIKSNKIINSVEALTNEKNKKVETKVVKNNMEDAKFVVQPPVNIVPINIPILLKKRIAYDYAMTTKYNKVCTNILFRNAQIIPFLYLFYLGAKISYQIHC